MIHFGTGGWREIIGDGFTRANVRLLVQGLCDAMAAEGVVGRGVVVGYDRRFLSDVAAWWATEVFLGNEVPVTLVTRPAPTPMFMWTVRNKNCAYGIAVTASHNPALYNGIKVFTEGGRDADAEVTDALEKRINALGEADVRALEPEAARASSLLTRQSSLNWYIDAILEQLDVETIRHRHLTIVLDPMFGVAQTCLQTILMTARCQVDVINDRHDALFGGRLPSPNAATLEPLRQAVLERGADLGIATDGDADRLGIIDDAGTFLHPNQILVLLYEHLLSGKAGRARPSATCPPRTCSTGSPPLTVSAATSAGRVQVDLGEDGRDGRRDRRGVVGRADRSRPHRRQGRGVRRQPAGRDGGRVRHAAQRAVRRSDRPLWRRRVRRDVVPVRRRAPG